MTITGEYTKLFKKTKFGYLWGSQILSQVTIHIMNFLLLAKLYETTGSSIATALLWVAYSLPALFFGPIGAAVVDIVSRRKLLMYTNILQAAAVFLFVLVHSQNIFILYALVLIYSLFNQFYVPAEASYLPSAVNKDDLPQANSLFFISQQGSLILGFGLAGIIQKLVGFEGAMILCGVLLFFAFVCTYLLPEVKPQTELPEKIEKALKQFFDSIFEGYDFIKANKLVLYPLALLLGIQTALNIIVVSLPVIAVQILGISVNYSGLSIVVPAGIGAMLGSVAIPRLLSKQKRKKKVIESSLLFIAIAFLSMTLGIPLLPVYMRVIVTPLLIMLVGFGFVGVNIPTLTFLQSVTPTWLLGRVMGNMFFFLTIISLFPVLFSGTITEIFGIRTLLTIIGIGAFAVYMFSKRNGTAFIREEMKNV